MRDSEIDANIADCERGMQLTFDDIQPVRARKRDPEPSHRAARNAEKFAESHAGKIVAALKRYGQNSTHRVAELSGLSVVQVDRRVIELRRAGLVRVVSEDGRYSVLEAV